MWDLEDLERMRKRALAGFAALSAQFKTAAGKTETADEKEYAQFAQDIKSAQTLYEMGDEEKTMEIMNALKDAFDHRASKLNASVNNRFRDKFSIARYKTLREAKKCKGYRGRLKSMIYDIGFTIKQPPAAAP